MRGKAEVVKKLAIVILACLLMACSLFLIKSFTAANSGEKSSAELVSASEKRLQSQIHDLSTKMSTFDNIVSQFQSQTKANGTATDSPPDQQGLSEIDVIKGDARNLATEVDSLQTQVADLQSSLNAGDAENLTTKMDSLQTQVTELQNKLKVAETAIGITPVAMNGLSIMFITNDIELGITGSSSQSAAQFAIKIINTTSSAITSVDVTGTITGSHSFFYEPLASGYPQLTDGAGLCSYVFYIEQGQTLHFEAFGNAKTSLSIPVGGSITLRPKISMSPAADQALSVMTLRIALKAITYDRAVTK
jgi:uncharacterized protein YlxW (UPF0749 family)